MEDYVKSKSYSGLVFFYGRKVTQESLASNLIYLLRTVVFSPKYNQIPFLRW